MFDVPLTILEEPVILHGGNGFTLISFVHWLTHPPTPVEFNVSDCGPGAVVITFTEELVFDPMIWRPADEVQK